MTVDKTVIDACPLCDNQGYRPNNGPVCDHVDRTEIHQRGMTAVRGVLAKMVKRPPMPPRADGPEAFAQRQRKLGPPKPWPGESEDPT